MELEYVKPAEIERRSFEIITKELEEKGILLPASEEYVTKRVIHTTADFEYAATLKFSDHATAVAESLIRQGATIVTDTNMALSGIHKKTLEQFGGQAVCYMAEEEVAKEAKERGLTRAAVSMEKALLMKQEKPLIIAVGNAPTALVRIHELLQEGRKPDFVIGIPVGFVNVEAAKELILDSELPYIVNTGRKGGSTVAAAIVNALLYHLAEKEMGHR